MRASIQGVMSVRYEYATGEPEFYQKWMRYHSYELLLVGVKLMVTATDVSPVRIQSGMDVRIVVLKGNIHHSYAGSHLVF